MLRGPKKPVKCVTTSGIRLFGVLYPFVNVLSAPECAHDTPRPRIVPSAGPRQVVIIGQTVERFGLAIIPAEFAYGVQAAPVGANPWTGCKAELTPVDPFKVNR